MTHRQIRVSLLLLTSLLSSLSGAETDLRGAAIVLDGDTLDIGSEVLQLYGLHAPTRAQSCRADGTEWPCGELAAAALQRMITASGGVVECQLLDSNAAPARAAICDAGDAGLNESMVRDGWALTDGDVSNVLHELELQAIESGHGIWRGGFVPNDAWRRFAGAAVEEEFAGCSSCSLRHRSLAERLADENAGLESAGD